MSDVVGLDGAWVSDFVKQGSLASLTDLMAQASYDDSELAAQIQLGGATYMIPVVNFVDPVFVNLDLMEKAAGIAAPPTTRSEFARRRAEAGPTPPTTSPAGSCRSLWSSRTAFRNDVMSWVWASGGEHDERGPA
jgi:multiple sugar transport system substrate-binding protein